jgi:hypothetical protein
MNNMKSKVLYIFLLLQLICINCVFSQNSRMINIVYSEYGIINKSYTIINIAITPDVESYWLYNGIAKRILIHKTFSVSIICPKMDTIYVKDHIISKIVKMIRVIPVDKIRGNSSYHHYHIYKQDRICFKLSDLMPSLYIHNSQKEKIAMPELLLNSISVSDSIRKIVIESESFKQQSNKNPYILMSCKSYPKYIEVTILPIAKDEIPYGRVNGFFRISNVYVIVSGYFPSKLFTKRNIYYFWKKRYEQLPYGSGPSWRFLYDNNTLSLWNFIYRS